MLHNGLEYFRITTQGSFCTQSKGEIFRMKKGATRQIHNRFQANDAFSTKAVVTVWLP